MAPTIRDLKPYVPARDFELSKRFYAAMGFAQSEGWGGTVDCSLGGFVFRLQDHYVKAWADNCMFVMTVDDAKAWHSLALRVAAEAEFSSIRVESPEVVGDSTVLHVVDPSGVLLVFVQ